MDRLHTYFALLVLFGVAAQTHGQRLTTTRVLGGLESPVGIAFVPGDATRLFIVEKTGNIVIRHDDGSTSVFLDVSDLLALSSNEQGLLGLAFHPDSANNGLFFINYTEVETNDTVVTRYEVSQNDPDVADPNSATEIFRMPQPFLNHNGGNLQFGPDGYLYIGTGDGGAGGDPGNLAQDLLAYHGKILRLDIDNPDQGRAYGIPADNPYVNDPDALDEIWASGLRNPWRYSFDRATGDLYIGDVGQDQWEEISYQRGDSSGAENYGWRLKEGTHCFNPPEDCDPGGLTDPIYEYEHTFNFPFRCSVTGGFVYRGESIPLLQGTYFFSDWCSNEILSFRYDGTNLTEFTDRTAELDPPDTQIRNVTSFGEDSDGELYLLGEFGGGNLFRIETAMQLDVPPLVAGQNATLSVTGATGNRRVYFVYSLTGTGRTAVPPLGVDLALSNPVLGGSAAANGSGVATFTAFVPVIAQGANVWVQATEAGNTSNVVTTRIL